MSQANSSDNSSPTRTSNASKWIWGLIGLASAAALGVVVSRKLPMKRNEASPVGDWQLISRIDDVLSRAGVSGIDVYVNGRRVMLITEAGSGADVLNAKSIVEDLSGVESVEVVVKHIGDSVSYSRQTEL